MVDGGGAECLSHELEWTLGVAIGFWRPQMEAREEGVRGSTRGYEDGSGRGKRVKSEQAADESPSVFGGKLGHQRENKPGNHSGAALVSSLSRVYLSQEMLKCSLPLPTPSSVGMN